MKNKAKKRQAEAEPVVEADEDEEQVQHMNGGASDDDAEQELNGDDAEEHDDDDDGSEEEEAQDDDADEADMQTDGVVKMADVMKSDFLIPQDAHEPDGPLRFDLGNLTLVDARPISASELSAHPAEYLLQLAKSTTQLLINKIWTLPTEPAVMGRLATLPKPTIQLPREKPIPKPKPPTKWEQFAALKGIVKKKRGRMIYDEEKQAYMPRFGYKRANDESSNWVFEHKEGQDASVDPWTRLGKEKKERVQKNQEQQAKNQWRAAQGPKVPGTLDLTSVRTPKGPQKGKPKKHVDLAMAAVQKSTASMGKFDRKVENEPKMKAVEKPKKRDVEFSGNLKAEKAANLNVLSKILNKDSDKISVAKAVSVVQRQSEDANGRNKRRRTK